MADSEIDGYRATDRLIQIADTGAEGPAYPAMVPRQHGAGWPGEVGGIGCQQRRIESQQGAVRQLERRLEPGVELEPGCRHQGEPSVRAGAGCLDPDRACRVSVAAGLPIPNESAATSATWTAAAGAPIIRVILRATSSFRAPSSFSHRGCHREPRSSVAIPPLSGEIASGALPFSIRSFIPRATVGCVRPTSDRMRRAGGTRRSLRNG